MMSEEVAYVIDGKTGERLPVTELAKRSERKILGRFICGPVPLVWVRKVAKLSKSGILMALGIAYIRGLERKDTFRLSPARLQEAGVTKSARTRGLRDLKRAGIIHVLNAGRGRAPLIKVMWDG